MPEGGSGPGSAFSLSHTDWSFLLPQTLQRARPPAGACPAHTEYPKGWGFSGGDSEEAVASYKGRCANFLFEEG